MACTRPCVFVLIIIRRNSSCSDLYSTFHLNLLKVSRHLSKLFDSMAKLKFKLDANGKPVKVGMGMYSKEDEYVDFDKECDCSGQVGGLFLSNSPSVL